MRDVTACPECGGETRLEWTQNVWQTEVLHTRTCGECPTQFVVSYADPRVVDVTTFDEWDED